MTTVTTFLVAGEERAAIEALSGLGFVFGPSRDTPTTLLDTFDGRLHRAGLRLRSTGSNSVDRRSTQSNSVELELSGPGTTPARLAVDATPRVPADLPAGPFRTRLDELVDVRALLPRLGISSRRSIGVLRDAADKVVADAVLHEAVQILDPIDDTGIDNTTIDDTTIDNATIDNATIDDTTIETGFEATIGSTLEIHEVPGFAKEARRALRTLRRLGVTECDADTLMLCATAAGVELSGFAATATVPLDPEMEMIEGMRLVLANLATTITANWQGTIDQADPEFLHDLRIAVRRTRTVLASAKKVIPTEILDPTRNEFVWLAGLTSTPRDLDVYLLEWSSYTDPLGIDVARQLEPVRDLLERRRADTHTELERGLRSDRAAALMDTWHAWLTEPLVGDSLPSRARRPLGPLVAEHIARAHHHLLSRGRLIGPDTPAAQVHDLRKDAKKLRYLLECFGSLLPSGPRKKYVKRLKALQDNLGEHQDAEVHVDMLRGVAPGLLETGASADTMVAVGQLTERLEQQRLAARIEFAERFADYDTPATQHALDAVLEGIVG